MASETENTKQIEELKGELRSQARLLAQILDKLDSVGSVGRSGGGDANALLAFMMKSLEQERADRMQMLDRVIDLVSDRAESGVGEVDPNVALQLIAKSVAVAAQRNQGAAESGASRGSNGTERPDNAPRSQENPRQG